MAGGHLTPRPPSIAGGCAWLGRALFALAAGVVLAAALGHPLRAEEPTRLEPLPSLAIDPDSVTLSGVSSGANIAQQFHVAHSASVAGIGVLAASPYHCAGGGYPFNLLRTTNICMDAPDLVPFLGPPAPESSLDRTKEEARLGRIDDPANLRGDRVWIFAGRRDEQVPPAMATVVGEVYETFAGAANVAAVTEVDAGHAMVTQDFGNACATSKHPFINDCDFDAAGALLAHLYGPLKPPQEGGGRILHIDQTLFDCDAEDHGLAGEGYLFVPQACADGATCRLHVVFHGCQQAADAIGREFVEGAGYNRWAAANRIVVLYPQAAPLRYRLLGLIPLPWPNPLGCWDWWGFTGPDFHVKSGAQIRAIEAMIATLIGRTQSR